ncbi:hypothetical protein ASF60_12660 [Methylobacterium sp. Leaf113]|uniref:SMP-30/gluconolactonase/LRE family protein n=1 Tax=Methylobacterium sp. Leaf113 TaxID=1736259 RepID=UPI0006FC8954|nr:SMP-30/gluconolactonase/LRE family protein [Methylobacterium sp. Leaf113]KQP94303.1 hypothetical protein ASF60_12660 [Methylobacterium sp. Leaf113]
MDHATPPYAFVENVPHPEDLVRLEGTAWIVVSSMPSPRGGGGRLSVVDTEHPDRPPFALFPSADMLTGAPVAGTFSPHGINTRATGPGAFELYVVDHGAGEAVDIFDLAVTPSGPRGRAVRRVAMPPGTWGNGIAPTPEGGFVVTSMFDPDDPDFLAKFEAGTPTGGVWHWSPEGGWASIAPRPLSGANGIELTRDGRFVIVSEWATRRLWRFPLTGEGGITAVDLDFLPDNLRWGSDGRLLLAGQNATPRAVFGCEAAGRPCPMAFTVVEVDPETLATRVVVRGGDSRFGGATGALGVGGEVWVASFTGQRVARYLRPGRP